MIGKSLQEMTTMLGQATPTVSCFRWELAEGKLTVCYELGDNAKRLMSSIDYELKPDFAVSSPAEMMALIKLDVQGREAKEDRRGFFTYDNISMNGKSGFVDIHRRSTNSIFGSRAPIYVLAEFHIQNPEIHLYSSPDLNGKETTFMSSRQT
jgi:hypothetical protein